MSVQSVGGGPGSPPCETIKPIQHSPFKGHCHSTLEELDSHDIRYPLKTAKMARSGLSAGSTIASSGGLAGALSRVFLRSYPLADVIGLVCIIACWILVGLHPLNKVINSLVLTVSPTLDSDSCDSLPPNVRSRQPSYSVSFRDSRASSRLLV